MIFLIGWKIRAAIFLPALAFCVLAFTPANARADLSPRQARKAITRMAGFELPNGAVRVKTISITNAAAAEVSAEIQTVFKFEQDKQGSWRVAEIRTGQDHWEDINLLATALKTQIATNECNAPDPPFRGAAALDPSVKRARCLLGSLLGVQVPSDAIRIQEVDPMPIPLASQASAVVVAWVRVNARLLNGQKGWQVVELRTGNREWISLERLVAAVSEEKQKQARAELESIVRALEQFHRDRGSYVVSGRQAVVIDQLTPRYLLQVIRLDPWHQPYKYEGERNRFTLRSTGPDGKDATADDIIFSQSP